MRTEVSEHQGGVPTAPEKGQVSHGGSGERPPCLLILSPPSPRALLGGVPLNSRFSPPQKAPPPVSWAAG